MDINRTWSEIDFEGMKRNYDVVKELSDSGMSILGMSSANAYTFEPITGGPMQGICPQFLTVRTIEDGCALRGGGVTLPILVRDYPRPENVVKYVKTLHRNFLAQSVDSAEVLQALAARVIPIFGGLLAIHLKVEIGSVGAGFCCLNSESPIDDLLAAKSYLGLYCEGIYTELMAEEPDESKASKIKALNELAGRLEQATNKPFAVKHYFIK